jgi:hypothetical protein
MTTPVADERRGFEVKQVFYEYVPISEWLNQDFVLARSITRVGIDDLVSGHADYIALQQATLAVAVWHANPDQTMDRIIRHVNGLKPAEIEEIGFDDDIEPEETPVPLDEPPPKKSAVTGDSPSESKSAS